MANGTNKHGIPMYGASAPRAVQCVWPRCAERKSVRYDLEVCDAHAIFIHGKVKAREDADDVRRIDRYIEAQQRRADREAEESAAKAETARIARQQQDGWIYYVKNAGHIKIGWTADLTTRLRHYPPGSELLAVHPGTRTDEARLHKRFTVHRTHGREWYPLAAVLVQHVDAMVREHGKPDAVTFGARPVEVLTPHRLKQVTKPRGWVGR